MVDLVGEVVGVAEQLLQFGDILPGFAEVEGAEVLVEGLVFQILHGQGRTLSILK